MTDMLLNIALVANTLKRVDQEMRRIYEENKEDIISYMKTSRRIYFKDGTLLTGRTIADNQWMKYHDYDQVLLTTDLDYCSALMDYYYRLESRSCIPPQYIFMTLEDDI